VGSLTTTIGLAWWSMGFKRSIIIQADVDRYMDPGRRNPKTLTANPPAATAPGGVAAPSEDDYLTKVVEYIPPEVRSLGL
jgi:hypothetical protein